LSQCLADRRIGLRQQALLEADPGERVVGMDVLAQFEVFPRQGEGLVQVPIFGGAEEGPAD
jgi:hypothetical protein